MRIIRWIVLVSWVLALAGCEGGDESSSSDARPGEATGASSASADESTAAGEEAESDGMFTREVAILPMAPLVRRPEDELNVRLRHSTRSIIYPVPNGWEPEPEVEGAEWADQMRVPAPFTEDYGDGFVTVYFSDGEEVDEILNRWLEQIDEPAYTPEIRDLEFVDQTLLLITEFVGVGTYNPGEFEPREDMMVLGAVVEGGPEGTLVFKGVGPRPLMEAQRFKWDLLLRSLRPLRHGAAHD